MNKRYLRRILLTALGLLVGVHLSAAQSYHTKAAPEDSTKLRQLFEQGQIDARRDMQTGSTKYKLFDLPKPWHRQYAELVSSSYNVELVFGPDFVSPEESAYWNGYNDIVEVELFRKYGTAVLNNASYQASHDYNRVRPSEQPLNPEVLRNVHLTNEAVAAGISGFVPVQFDIQPNGLPTNLVVKQSLGYGLDEVALDAVGMLRFEAAEDTANGVSLEHLVVAIRF